MIEAPISTPPKAYMDIISPLINSARGFLESGEALQAFAFVGSLSRNQVVPVMIQSGADAVKDQSASLIQSAALVLGGRLRLHDHGSLVASARQGAADGMRSSISTEASAPHLTRSTCARLHWKPSEGVWVAQPRIKPKGISKKKRTIGVVEFRFYTEVKGRFTHLLPVKEGDEPPTILH
jgi:hypothetical protein